VHELHLELFGDALTGLYFHALLMHGPVQHEVVCSRSVNADKEERLFKSAGTAAKCTDRKPENMLPVILKCLQVKHASTSAAINPILELRSKNSRISTHAKGLSAYKDSDEEGMDPATTICLASTPRENCPLPVRRKGAMVESFGHR
jgi:hypothetical protein